MIRVLTQSIYFFGITPVINIGRGPSCANNFVFDDDLVKADNNPYNLTRAFISYSETVCRCIRMYVCLRWYYRYQRARVSIYLGRKFEKGKVKCILITFAKFLTSNAGTYKD